MNDYYAHAYTNLRLAELRVEAHRGRRLPGRPARGPLARAVDWFDDTLRGPGRPAQTPVACCA